MADSCFTAACPRSIPGSALSRADHEAKPNSAPGAPDPSGEASWISPSGPTLDMPSPESPFSRQKGLSYTATTLAWAGSSAQGGKEHGYQDCSNAAGGSAFLPNMSARGKGTNGGGCFGRGGGGGGGGGGDNDNDNEEDDNDE